MGDLSIPRNARNDLGAIFRVAILEEISRDVGNRCFRRRHRELWDFSRRDGAFLYGALRHVGTFHDRRRDIRNISSHHVDLAQSWTLHDLCRRNGVDHHDRLSAGSFLFRFIRVHLLLVACTISMACVGTRDVLDARRDFLH